MTKATQQGIFETPMMQQYKKIKDEHADCILFFRLGDFYEMFLEDAKVGAEVLNITLTKRDRGSDGKIPMAGVPYHAVDVYLNKLVKAGFKVAICEQVSEPDPKQKLVDREVVRIVTPGTLLDETALNSKENNYVATVSVSKKSDVLGFAFADVSTGNFETGQIQLKYNDKKNTHEHVASIISDHFSRFNPSECVLSEELYNNPQFLKHFTDLPDLNIFNFSQWDFYAKNYQKDLTSHFNISSVESLTQEKSTEALKASSALLGYLKETQKNKIAHIKKLNFYLESQALELNRSTIFNLELFSTIREGARKGSLISVLDKTVTSMGGRMLKQWVVRPLKNKSQIVKRHDAVEEFSKKRLEREKLRENLAQIYDIERILSRLTIGVGNARDLISLKESLVICIELKSHLKNYDAKLTKELSAQIVSQLSKIVEKIEKVIVNDPPIEIKHGGLIKHGVNKDLDLIKKEISQSQSWLANLESQERQSTGISTLKVGFNKVYGYYIEVTKNNSELVPNHYVRKQTLVNAERYMTQKLKEHEELVLTAEEKINDLEYGIFLQTVQEILKSTEEIQKCADSIAQLDCLMNFSHISEKNKYVRPQMLENSHLHIVDGRHPVVEKLLTDKDFVPNDVTLNHKDHQLLIITGPNMAGKSVFIRQTALIVLMAQIGCFVPAKSAEISVVDKIFVRSGASDFITSGLSTFMVEMVETAQILNNATKDSLVILDEIGRGTTTYDGVSIAWAVTEFLTQQAPFAKTLFATHYHELQDLEKESPLIKNYQVLVKEEFDETIFLHKVVEGGADSSYGITVAELAGMPKSVTNRAKEVLSKLEGVDFEDWLKS